jgi:hypothetical protein
MAIPKISQHNLFNSYSHPSFSLSFLSSYTPLSSILSPFRLRSVFLAAPFPPSLSFRRIGSTCARSSSRHILHLLSSPYVQYLVHSLSRYTGTSSVMHLASLILPVIPAFSPFSLACPCLCPSRAAPRSSIFR